MRPLTFSSCVIFYIYFKHQPRKGFYALRHLHDCLLFCYCPIPDSAQIAAPPRCSTSIDWTIQPAVMYKRMSCIPPSDALVWIFQLTMLVHLLICKIVYQAVVCQLWVYPGLTPLWTVGASDNTKAYERSSWLRWLGGAWCSRCGLVCGKEWWVGD